MCNETPIPYGLNALEMKHLARAIVGHEVGHGLHVAHDKVNCGDLMFDTEATGLDRRAMSAYYPIPDRYSRDATDQIRLYDNP